MIGDAQSVRDGEHTEWLPAFHTSKEQREFVAAWKQEHNLVHTPAGQKHRPVGAIGGAYTWEFTSTSLGVVTCVRCACGEKIDVSDYNDW